ncbi:MAG: hypothetical protein NC548_36895 [Lachnospiraceae bacterium]|nr:hypothetical protein [Lachnospiraceae bacterium]
MTTTTILALSWLTFAFGYYVGRCSAKDRQYIKGYRDGIIDGGKSIQDIISKNKGK